MKSLIEMKDARIYLDSGGYKRLVGVIDQHPTLVGEASLYVKTSAIQKEHSERLFETLNNIYNVVSWAEKTKADK